MIDIVQEYERGLSIRQIACKSPFSASKIRKILISSNIDMRSSRDGLRLRKENSMPLNAEMMERIEGELLGDGCLIRRNYQSKFSFTNSKKEYTFWLAELFVKSGIDLTGSGAYKDVYFHKNWDKWYTRYNFSTLCSIQFKDLETKWYKERKKMVPEDLIISPNLVLHWFLGDGSLPRQEYAIFCTDGFSLEEVSILSEKLNEAINIKSSVMPYGKYHRLFVPKTSVPKLLEYVGKPPICALAYKWKLNPIGRINHKMDISKQTLYKLYIKDGLTRVLVAEKLGCAKSTIDKKLKLFKIRRNR